MREVVSASAVQSTHQPERLAGRFTTLEAHMAALLNSVPVVNQRSDRLEARIAALEASRGG
jgi:hypothetical protein